jgi:uncharacterized membrane protein
MAGSNDVTPGLRPTTTTALAPVIALAQYRAARLEAEFAATLQAAERAVAHRAAMRDQLRELLAAVERREVRGVTFVADMGDHEHEWMALGTHADDPTAAQDAVSLAADDLERYIDETVKR